MVQARIAAQEQMKFQMNQTPSGESVPVQPKAVIDVDQWEFNSKSASYED